MSHYVFDYREVVVYPQAVPHVHPRKVRYAGKVFIDECECAGSCDVDIKERLCDIYELLLEEKGIEVTI